MPLLAHGKQAPIAVMQNERSKTMKHLHNLILNTITDFALVILAAGILSADGDYPERSMMAILIALFWLIPFTFINRERWCNND